MAAIQEKRSYPGKSAKECYHAALQALSHTGYTIFRKRDYGWFVIATRKVSGQEVTCNILASLGEAPSLDVNLTARSLPEEVLRQCAEEIFANVQASLG